MGRRQCDGCRGLVEHSMTRIADVTSPTELLPYFDEEAALIEHWAGDWVRIVVYGAKRDKRKLSTARMPPVVIRHCDGCGGLVEPPVAVESGWNVVLCLMCFDRWKVRDGGLDAGSLKVGYLDPKPVLSI